MAGNSRYHLAKKALIEYQGESLKLDILKTIIRRELASKEASVIEYLKLMDATGLIKEVILKNGSSVFQVQENGQRRINETK